LTTYLGGLEGGGGDAGNGGYRSPPWEGITLATEPPWRRS